MENIRNMSIREKAYYLLREAVIDGSLKPGERLVEDSLAAQYNVSRTPLREAIHKLEMEGFLQRLPSRGLVVAELSGLSGRTAATRSAGNILKRWTCTLPGTAGWESARPGVWNRLIRNICRLWMLCWQGIPRPRRRP